MKANFPIEQFRKLETPFYYYDTNLLRETLNKIKEEAGKYNKFCVLELLRSVRADQQNR